MEYYSRIEERTFSSELSLERSFCVSTAGLGYRSHRLDYEGEPDVLFVHPTLPCFYAEFKTGSKLTPLQAVRYLDATDAGYACAIIRPEGVLVNEHFRVQVPGYIGYGGCAAVRAAFASDVRTINNVLTIRSARV